jgi:hypothetical protein
LMMHQISTVMEGKFLIKIDSLVYHTQTRKSKITEVKLTEELLVKAHTLEKLQTQFSLEISHSTQTKTPFENSSPIVERLLMSVSQKPQKERQKDSATLNSKILKPLTTPSPKTVSSWTVETSESTCQNLQKREEASAEVEAVEEASVEAEVVTEEGSVEAEEAVVAIVLVDEAEGEEEAVVAGEVMMTNYFF